MNDPLTTENVTQIKELADLLSDAMMTASYSAIFHAQSETDTDIEPQREQAVGVGGIPRDQINSDINQDVGSSETNSLDEAEVQDIRFGVRAIIIHNPV